MAVNLSHPARMSVGSFYTPIHLQIDDVAAAGLPPSVVEFKTWIDAQSPRPGLPALDAGCGAHVLNSRLLARAGYRALSLDLNADAVDAARRYGLSAVRGSVLSLPFGDGRFSVSVCSGVAHHTPDPWQAFRELHRVLAPDGRLYLSLYTFAGSPAEWAVRGLRLLGRLVPFRLAHRLGRSSAVVNNFILDHMYVPILWLFTASEVEAYLRSIGFAVEASTATVGVSQSTLGRALTGDGLLRTFICRKLPRRDA